MVTVNFFKFLNTGEQFMHNFFAQIDANKLKILI